MLLNKTSLFEQDAFIMVLITFLRKSMVREQVVQFGIILNSYLMEMMPICVYWLINILHKIQISLLLLRTNNLSHYAAGHLFYVIPISSKLPYYHFAETEQFYYQILYNIHATTIQNNLSH